jgi:hypothetical protein
MRFQVHDESGAMLRRFYTKAEAVAFMQPNWTLVILPRKKQLDIHALLGDAPF